VDDILESLFEQFDNQPMLAIGLLIFLAVATLTFGVMGAMRVRGDVRRRAAGVVAEGTRLPGEDARSLRHASRKAAQRLVDYADKHYSGGNDGNIRQLRRRLMQAGFLDPRAPALFFLARLASALIIASSTFFCAPSLVAQVGQSLWLATWVAGIVGFFLPAVYLNRRITSRQNEHRSGFPDFMDLLVVCADAGLAMEAALDRVGRELGDSYPSLSSNIYMTTLEIRAGRPVCEALENLGDRLGLEEARSFATLIQQSEELGSSVTEALRVYSDDMRHKRLSRAEEKAYSLPAKLSVPLTMCVFPVVIVVIMLPVYVRFKVGAY